MGSLEDQSKVTYGQLLWGKRPIPYHSTVLRGVQLPHAPLKAKNIDKNLYLNQIGGPMGLYGDTYAYFTQQTGIGFRIANAVSLGYLMLLERVGWLSLSKKTYWFRVDLLGFDVKSKKYVKLSENPENPNVIPLSGNLDKLKEL